MSSEGKIGNYILRWSTILVIWMNSLINSSWYLSSSRNVNKNANSNLMLMISCSCWSRSKEINWKPRIIRGSILKNCKNENHLFTKSSSMKLNWNRKMQRSNSWKTLLGWKNQKLRPIVTLSMKCRGKLMKRVVNTLLLDCNVNLKIISWKYANWKSWLTPNHNRLAYWITSLIVRISRLVIFRKSWNIYQKRIFNTRKKSRTWIVWYSSAIRNWNSWKIRISSNLRKSEKKI